MNSANISFELWSESLQNMDFDHYSNAIKDKILESNEVDNEFKNQFTDCFDYVFKLYKQNKPLEPNLIKIYLEQVKGYKNIKMTELFRIMLLLTYCGFQFSK